MARSRLTALVTLLLAILVHASAVAVAQTEQEPQRAVEPAAGIDADRVDGRHAVKFTNKPGIRKNKLIATNRQGFLPSNIVKPYWGYILNKPGFLADGQIGWDEVVSKPSVLADGQVRWNEVGGKPAGFSDGVDDAGVTAIGITRIEVAPTVSPGSFNLQANCPQGSLVVGGGYNSPVADVTILRTYPSDRDTWTVYGYNNHGSNIAMRAYAICLRTTPGGAISYSSN